MPGVARVVFHPLFSEKQFESRGQVIHTSMGGMQLALPVWRKARGHVACCSPAECRRLDQAMKQITIFTAAAAAQSIIIYASINQSINHKNQLTH